MINSIINDNTCNNDGTIYVDSGTIYFENIEWKRNYVQNGSGSALYMNSDGNDVTILNNKFVSNWAFVDGTISMYSGDAQIINSTFDNNRADTGSGAALYIATSGSIDMISCIISNHYSNINGTVHLLHGSMSMNNAQFTNNEANNGYGSSIYLSDGLLLCFCLRF